MGELSELLRIAMPSGGAIWAQVDVGSFDPTEFAEVEIEESIEVAAVGIDDDFGIADVGIKRFLQKVKKLTDFKETISSVALSVHEGFAELPQEKVPDKVSVEFAVEISGKTGQLVGALAEVGSKAAIKVTVEWEEMAARIGGGK